MRKKNHVFGVHTSGCVPGQWVRLIMNSTFNAFHSSELRWVFLQSFFFAGSRFAGFYLLITWPILTFTSTRYGMPLIQALALFHLRCSNHWLHNFGFIICTGNDKKSTIIVVRSSIIVESNQRNFFYMQKKDTEKKLSHIITVVPRCQLAYSNKVTKGVWRHQQITTTTKTNHTNLSLCSLLHWRSISLPLKHRKFSSFFCCCSPPLGTFIICTILCRCLIPFSKILFFLGNGGGGLISSLESFRSNSQNSWNKNTEKYQEFNAKIDRTTSIENQHSTHTVKKNLFEVFFFRVVVGSLNGRRQKIVTNVN